LTFFFRVNVPLIVRIQKKVSEVGSFVEISKFHAAPAPSKNVHATPAPIKTYLLTEHAKIVEYKER
jgi:hypothetical protein